MKLKSQSEKLLIDLKEIRTKNKDTLQRSLCSIKVCNNLLNSFKREILNKKFSSVNEEVLFFKEIKHIPLTKLIYFSEIHSFEIQLPKSDKEQQLKYLKKKINKLNRFFRNNLDFCSYVDSGATHFDKEFYTRDSLEKFNFTICKRHFQDPDFCTPKDMLLGEYRAYYALTVYLDKRRLSMKTRLNKHQKVVKKKLEWPFNNTDYVEMLYALCASGLGKKNNLSIMKVSEHFQKIFDFNPKDIYKTYQDIKLRKNSKTLFLDELTARLVSDMIKSED
ncbi:RteC domain-containing protein [Gelidibacter pelagius]|uniref:RteC domain-containing protein n=1 Tax=Gelidibacter pelagius TaxID=2819985 RepID=A0ABS3SQ88_9FLAO|nr:RteC domain-containing protein [Gelidibacter pelagius]MBO3097865.1 RteC domain-containing protein [Gelidibacter pelagius]